MLQLTNAIKNSLEHNPSGQPYDGPMGVTISITPAHILDSLNKQAITNASFKTQKLPGNVSSTLPSQLLAHRGNIKYLIPLCIGLRTFTIGLSMIRLFDLPID